MENVTGLIGFDFCFGLFATFKSHDKRNDRKVVVIGDVTIINVFLQNVAISFFHTQIVYIKNIEISKKYINQMKSYILSIRKSPL